MSQELIDEHGPMMARDGGPGLPVIVTTIGTCRLADPIAAAARQLPMRRDLTNVYGFVHTTKEILQQLDVFEGRREIPAELVRFVASAEYHPWRPRDQADLFLVEVSSAKEIHFRDHVLQINCMDRIFQTRRELFDTFFRHKYASERPTRAARLAQLASFNEADETEKAVLLEGHVHLTTREELEADLQTIAARLPAPIVFACHIDVPDSTGKPIESRAKLCRWMREICAERGYTFFDPGPQVDAYGRTAALAEDGRDTNHYSIEFKSILGGMLFETYALPLMESRQALDSATEASTATAATAAPPAVLPAAAPSAPPAARDIPAEPAPVAVESAPVPAPKPAPARLPSPVSQDVRQIVHDAKGLLSRGEVEDAELLLRGAAIDHPHAVEIFSLLGTVAYHRGDNSMALADLRHALELDPAAAEPKIMLVKIAQRLNRLEEACTQAMELVASAPEDHKALAVAAKALIKAKRFHEAASVWRRVAMLRPEIASPLTEAARCELKSRSYDEAVKAADQALARDPAELGALVIKAEALQRSKRVEELGGVVLRLAVLDPAAAHAMVPALIAGTHLESAAAAVAALRERGHGPAHDPILQAGLVRSLTQRARAATDRGDESAAAAAWKAVLLMEPESRRAASGLRKLVAPLLAEARLRARTGDFAGAVTICRRGLAFEPANQRLLREMGGLLERREEWAAAAQAWETLAEAEGLPQRTLVRASRAAARAGRPDEALRLYTRLPAETLAQMGSTLGSLTRKLVKLMREEFAGGRYDAAVGKARIVLGSDAQNVAAHRLLAKAVASYRKILKEATAGGDLARMEDTARRILDIDANRSDALKVLSKLYSGAKRWPESIEVQQRLVELDPGEPRHWQKLATSCRAAKRWDLGVAAALRAVELEPDNTRSMDTLSDLLNKQALAA